MILDDNRVVNYRGLEYFLEKLKGFFIKKPETGTPGLYLRRTDSGNVEWASFPTVFRWKGKKDNISEIWAITDALEGDVWGCAGDEYYCVEPTTPSDYGQSHWDLLGSIFPEYIAGANISINDTVDPRVISAIGYTYGNNASFAEGTSTATGAYSHSEGASTTASSSSSHAEGSNTISKGTASHAEGSYTKASGQYSHAEGENTSATYSGAHSEGKYTAATGQNAHSEGEGIRSRIGTIETVSVDYLSFTVPSSGVRISDFVVDNFIECADEIVRIESVDSDTRTITVDYELYSALPGDYIYSRKGLSYDRAAHSEGLNTVAFGVASHSEGDSTIASGEKSHTEGDHTTANNLSEHAEGRYNVSNKANTTWGDSGNTIHSIGIGSSSLRKNAVEVMQNGDVYVLGVGTYDGTNPTTASTLQASLGDNNVLADWTEANSSSDAFIKNKPSLATVATSGAYSDLSGTPSLATVATSGSYTDLTNTPSIPAAQVNSDWDASSGVAKILNKPSLATVATTGAYSDLSGAPSLATVATSGSYSDLSNTPTIPIVNDATYSVKTDVSGTETTVSDFTANLSTADSITFVQGNNVTLTPDTTNSKITIAATDTHYTADLVLANASNSPYNTVIETSNSSTYLNTVENSSVSGSILVTGAGNISVSASNGILTVRDNSAETINTYTSGGIDITDETPKYVLVGDMNISSGSDLYFNIDTASDGIYPKEVIVHLAGQDNSYSLYIRKKPNTTFASNGELEDFSSMYNVSVSGYPILANTSVEFIFTFWNSTLVTFNGGTLG